MDTTAIRPWACPDYRVRTGVDFARQVILRQHAGHAGSRFGRLRRMVAQVCADLTLREVLRQQGIPFDVLAATRFTHPERLGLRISGRLWHLVTFLITHPDTVRRIQAEPDLIRQAPALIPTDALQRGGIQPEDGFLFLWVTASRHPAAAEQPNALCWLALPPAVWASPRIWAPFTSLALKSEQPPALQLTLGGLDGEHQVQTHSLELPARTRCEIPTRLYTLGWVQAAKPPQGRLGISTPRLKRPWIIQASDWGNIWLYDVQVWLAGGITVRDFQARAERIPPGSRVLQYRRTRIANLGIPSARLHPLPELLTG